MTEPQRKSPGELAHEYLSNGDPTGWFEALYAASNTDGEGIPWAHLRPHPALLSWLEETATCGEGKTALVVGCGLGDDAEELARRGFIVTAFDVSASAIALCRRRFPRAAVDYVHADLFAPPGGWPRGFDFVLESITVQALPPEMQPKAIRQVAGFVAPGGILLMMTWLRTPQQAPHGPPWPLTHATLDGYLAAGLTEHSREADVPDETPQFRHIRIVYHRPA